MGVRMKPLRTRWSLSVAVAWAVLFGGAVRAVQVISIPLPGTDSWKHQELPKVDRDTEYRVVRDGDRRVLHAHARCSASALVLESPQVDLQKTPVLSWEWKVVRPLSIENEKIRSGDDFALRVYVLFRFDPARASWWERARHALGRKLFGVDLPGAGISYVWSSRAPAGMSWPNPFAGDVRMVSLGPGHPGSWRRASVNVLQDYRRLFGEQPPPVAGLGVMADADNSCQEAEGYITGLEWRGARNSAQGDEGSYDGQERN